MTRSLESDLYPNAPGSHQIFINTRLDPENPWRGSRPEAVVVVGLGAESTLTQALLVRSVRQAIIDEATADEPEGKAAWRVQYFWA